MRRQQRKVNEMPRPWRGKVKPVSCSRVCRAKSRSSLPLAAIAQRMCVLPSELRRALSAACASKGTPVSLCRVGCFDTVGNLYACLSTTLVLVFGNDVPTWIVQERALISLRPQKIRAAGTMRLVSGARRLGSKGRDRVLNSLLLKVDSVPCRSRRVPPREKCSTIGLLGTR